MRSGGCPLRASSPLGVTSHCTPARPSSTRIASSATRIAPASGPACRRRRSGERMKSPRVWTLASGAIVAVAMTFTALVLTPVMIVGAASGSSTLQRDRNLAHAHPARGLDRRPVDLADPDEGVGEDRGDREEHEGDCDDLEAGADERDHEGDQHQLRDGPAGVPGRDRKQLAPAPVTERHAEREGEQQPRRQRGRAQLDVRRAVNSPTWTRPPTSPRPSGTRPR